MTIVDLKLPKTEEQLASYIDAVKSASVVVQNLPRSERDSAWLVTDGQQLMSADVDHAQVAAHLEQAVNLLLFAQAQTLHALKVFSTAQLHPSLALGDGRPARKPRILVHAHINARGTLEVSWSAVMRPELENEPQKECGLAVTDFDEVENTWPYAGAGGNCILRFMERGFIRDVTPYGGVRQRFALQLLMDALTKALDGLLQTLSVPCEVRVGAWPVYKEGRLHISSPLERAAALITRHLDKVDVDAKKARQRLEAGLRSIGLSNDDELVALEAEAASRGESVAALLGATASARVTPSKVASVHSALSACQTLKAQTGLLERALIRLTHHRHPLCT